MIPKKHAKFFTKSKRPKRPRSALEAEDDDDLYNLARLEEKLGLRGPDGEKNKKKLKRELLDDGFDEELLGLLEDLDDVGPLSEDEGSSEASDDLSEPGSGSSESRDELRGLMNKLSEGNLELITEEVTKELLMKPNPSGFAKAVCELLTDSTSLTMMGVLCGLVTAVARLCGNAYATELLNELFKDETAAKSKAETWKFVGLSFAFGLLHVDFVETSISKLLQISDLAASLDAVVTLLRFAGSRLKRDYSSVLESAVKSVSSSVKTKGETLIASSRRLRILLEELEGFPRSAFGIMDHFEATTTWLRASEIFRKNKSVTLRTSEVSNFFGTGQTGDQTGPKRNVRKVESSRDRITELEEQADRLNLNSETKKSLFIAIMGAVNVDDAENRVLRVSSKLDEFFPMLVFCAIRETVAAKKAFYCELAARVIPRYKSVKAASSAFREALVKELTKASKYKAAALGNLAEIFVHVGLQHELVDLTLLRFANFQQSEKLQTAFVSPVLVALSKLSEELQEAATSSLQSSQFRDCQLALAVAMKERVLSATAASDAAPACDALMGRILH